MITYYFYYIFIIVHPFSAPAHTWGDVTKNVGRPISPNCGTEGGTLAARGAA